MHYFQFLQSSSIDFDVHIVFIWERADLKSTEIQTKLFFLSKHTTVVAWFFAGIVLEGLIGKSRNI